MRLVIALALLVAAAEPLVGVGLSVRIENDLPVIDSFIRQGPAERDGKLKVGDRIQALAQGEGPWEDSTGLSLEDFVAKVRGRSGSKVRLRAFRGKRGTAPKVVVVTLTREPLKQAP